MKPKSIVPILVVTLALIFATGSVFAQSSQVTSTVNLSHLSVQLTYPSQVVPGQSAIINLTALAKDSFQLTSLTVQVYLADQNNLQQLLSATVAQNIVMPSGNQIVKQFQVTVPSDAPRTSLVALVTESVSILPSSYSYPYAYPNWNGYSNWYGYGSYLYSSSYPYYYSAPSPYYYYSNPSFNPQSSSDNGIASLSYVLATTPEYVSLQSQYQQLQIQNQQLQQQLQASQNSTAQKDSTINTLKNQLSSTQGTTTFVEIVAVILALALVAVAALHFKPTRTIDTESHLPTKTEEKTTGI